MANTANHSANTPAFKEWQVICAALESGEQTLILRKGGIAEGRKGFSWQHREFFLFPTRFHQQVDGVQGSRQLAPAEAHNQVTIRLRAELVTSARLTHWDQVARLAEHHIWTEEVVRERFNWGDQPGLSVALLRVHRLDKPWCLEHADRAAFGGCRSWLNLPIAEAGGGDTPPTWLTSTQAVIDDAEFARQAEAIRALLDRQA
jgi:hypothetical protein